MYTCSVFGMVQYLLHPLFSAKKFALSRQKKQTPLDEKKKKKNTAKAQFRCRFSAKWKDRKGANMGR